MVHVQCSLLRGSDLCLVTERVAENGDEDLDRGITWIGFSSVHLTTMVAPVKIFILFKTFF